MNVSVGPPTRLIRNNAEEVAMKVLMTDMTNIEISQWHCEPHNEPGIQFIASCAINRRLDPLDKPIMLHLPAEDLEHLKMMFQGVEVLL